MIGGLIKKMLLNKKKNTSFEEKSNAKEMELKNQPIQPNLEKMIEIFNHIWNEKGARNRACRNFYNPAKVHHFPL